MSQMLHPSLYELPIGVEPIRRADVSPPVSKRKGELPLNYR